MDKLDRVLIGGIVVLLILIGITLSKSSNAPVRYSWQDKLGRQHCAVIYPDGKERACAEFSKEELNKFRLEYTDPHREKK